MEMETNNPVVPRYASEGYRETFTNEFEGHDTLTEYEDAAHTIEEADALPDDVTLQRIVASYEGVEVWLLNETGPLQAFYEETQTFGETGNVEAVAREMEERLL